MTSSMAMYHPY